MGHQSHSHSAPTQTTPDIYAAYTTFPVGTATEGGSFFQWGLNCTLGGHCLWRGVGQRHLVGAGDLVITKPHAWMNWRVVETDATRSSAPTMPTMSSVPGWETAYSLFHPRPHWHAWLDGLTYDHGMAYVHLTGRAARDMQRAMRQCARAYEEIGLLRDDRTMVALESALLSLYASSVRAQSGHDERVGRAIELMRTHFAEPLGLRDIARHAGLSESHFSHLFATAMGMPPGEYLEQIRLTRAAEMLRGSMLRIGDIARAAGYPDPNYFTYRFRLRYGQTPRQYRAAGRPQANSNDEPGA